MPYGRQTSQILSDNDLSQVLAILQTTRHPIRNRCLVPLSAKAGLRAAEIARLKRELTKLKAERDILKKAAAYLESTRSSPSSRSTG
jgi:transposase-like protein